MGSVNPEQSYAAFSREMRDEYITNPGDDNLAEIAENGQFINSHITLTTEDLEKSDKNLRLLIDPTLVPSTGIHSPILTKLVSSPLQSPLPTDRELS